MGVAPVSRRNFGALLHQLPHGRHHGWALHDELLTGAIFRAVYQAPIIALMPPIGV